MRYTFECNCFVVCFRLKRPLLDLGGPLNRRPGRGWKEERGPTGDSGITLSNSKAPVSTLNSKRLHFWILYEVGHRTELVNLRLLSVVDSTCTWTLTVVLRLCNEICLLAQVELLTFRRLTLPTVGERNP